MIILIIALCVFIILIVISFKIDSDLMVGLIVFIGLGAIAFAFISPALYTRNNEKEYKEEHYADICTLSTTVGGSGTFRLGYGHIETTGYYFYYIKDQNGYLSLKSLPADKCLIYETDEKEPCITKRTPYKMKEANWWFNYGGCVFSNSDSSMYIIYVPKGTVVEQFVGNI